MNNTNVQPVLVNDQPERCIQRESKCHFSSLHLCKVCNEADDNNVDVDTTYRIKIFDVFCDIIHPLLGILQSQFIFPTNSFFYFTLHDGTSYSIHITQIAKNKTTTTTTKKRIILSSLKSFTQIKNHTFHIHTIPFATNSILVST